LLKGHPSASDVIRHKVCPRQDAPTYLLCNEIHSEWIARYPDVNGVGSGTGKGRSSNAFTTVSGVSTEPQTQREDRYDRGDRTASEHSQAVADIQYEVACRFDCTVGLAFASPGDNVRIE